MTEVLKEEGNQLRWTERGHQQADLAEAHIMKIRGEKGFNELSHQDFYFIILTALNDYMMIERLGWNEEKEPSSQEPE